MRRITAIMTLATALLFAVVVVRGLAPSVSAQDASPVPEPFEIAPGVTAEAVAFAPGQVVPAVYRLHFEPGVTYSIAPDPSVALAYVEAGTLTLRLDAPVTVSQVSATDTAGEQIAADTEFTVTAGDYFVLAPNATGEVRNDGDDVATVTVAGILPEDGAATPEATPAA